MTDLQDLKQAARITRDENGEPVVEIPLSAWNEFLAVQESKPSQKQRVLDLLDEWEQDPENAMPAEWWDEFDEFLKANRVNFGERHLGFDDE
ncbi:MAG: hypothetical protein K8J31_31370 [Anaerolineae bacterium]|nr:hypothetical protein [Anaerolineae bacterium]